MKKKERVPLERKMKLKKGKKDNVLRIIKSFEPILFVLHQRYRL